MNAPDIRGLLRNMHREAHSLLLEEIADQTGGARRRCDAMSFGLWPSKGFTICGYEIKVSRSDWLREIQDPTKADTFADHCDYWWICAPAGIVKLEELPAGWGLMEPAKTKLRAKRPAAKRDATPMPRPMLASLLRRAVEGSDITRKLGEEYARGVQAGEKRAQASQQLAATRPTWERRAQDAEFAIAEFRKASGLDISRWNAGDVGRAVAAHLRGDGPRLADRARSAGDQLRGILMALDEVREALQAPHTNEREGQ